MATKVSADDSPIPADSEIRRIISERIDDQKQSVGIVVGTVEPPGRRIVAHGHFAQDDTRIVDGDTVYEIGSVTKVFTALLLAEMAQRGEVTLGDPVSKFLPKEVNLPCRDGKEIALEELATHTSGLPRMPDNMAPKNPLNPYADYSVQQMYEFLSGHRLRREIGEKFEYSNLGYGLLGHALALRAGTDYETLVRTRILAPLDMTSTDITLAPILETRLAAGHNHRLEAVPNWDLPTFAGAGALRSTTGDLLIFLETMLGYLESPLAPAIAAMLAVRRPRGMRSFTALGWAVDKSEDEEMIWHTGHTGGYSSFVGFLSKQMVGVVVLSNSSAPICVDDMGPHLLNADRPLAKQRTAVAIDPNLYNGYVGRYQLQVEFILTVTRKGDRLFAQVTGQQELEIFPEGERDFFLQGSGCSGDV